MKYDPKIHDYPNWKEEFTINYLDGTDNASWKIENRVLMYQWKENDKFHRLNDKPAKINNGHLSWWINGINYRENDKPCHIEKNSLMWKNERGQIHRDNDFPAIIHEDFGIKKWYKYGMEYIPPNEILLKCFENESFLDQIIYAINVSAPPKKVQRWIRPIFQDLSNKKRYELQDLVISFNPSLGSKFEHTLFDKLKEKYYGHYSLNEINL